jgi:hypothetical protein
VEGGAGEEDYVYDMLPSSLLDRILCPITGQPMKDPVVAADGHTYERYGGHTHQAEAEEGRGAALSPLLSYYQMRALCV